MRPVNSLHVPARLPFSTHGPKFKPGDRVESALGLLGTVVKAASGCCYTVRFDNGRTSNLLARNLIKTEL